MTTTSIDVGKQCGVVEGREIFERDEFHRQALFSFNRLLRDEPSHHGDAASNESMHVRGRDRPQPPDGLSIERQGMAAGEKPEGLDLVSSLLRSRIIVRNG